MIVTAYGLNIKQARDKLERQTDWGGRSGLCSGAARRPLVEGKEEEWMPQIGWGKGSRKGKECWGREWLG